jgi:membrane associated rhomboid family serine protease
MRNVYAEPTATYVLIAINVIAWLGAWISGGDTSSVYIDLGTIGHGQVLEGTHVSQIGVADGEYWRLVTGAFLHDPNNPLHILFNMYLLYLLGRMLEPALGHVRFVALYFASLLAGSFGALVAAPDELTVGASGAVFGLMSAAFVLQRARGIDPWRSGIGPLIIFNLALPFVFPGLNVSIGGHVGGLIGGALAAIAIDRLAVVRRGDLVPVLACVAIALVSVVGAVAVADGSGIG